jgi:hypothetical protein
MHRAPTLCRTARPTRAAIISTGTAWAARTAIIAALVVSTLSTLTGRAAGSAINRLTGTNGTGINGPAGNGARRTRRHARTRRRRRARCGRTSAEPRHHIGARRNHRPGLRLTGQIRFRRRTQRLRRRRRLRSGCAGSRHGWPRWRHARRGWARCSRRHDRRRRFRGIAHAGRQRLPRSGKNLTRPGGRHRLGRNRRSAARYRMCRSGRGCGNRDRRSRGLCRHMGYGRRRSNPLRRRRRRSRMMRSRRRQWNRGRVV